MVFVSWIISIVWQLQLIRFSQQLELTSGQQSVESIVNSSNIKRLTLDNNKLASKSLIINSKNLTINSKLNTRIIVKSPPIVLINTTTINSYYYPSSRSLISSASLIPQQYDVTSKNQLTIKSYFPEDEVEESEYRKDPSSWPQYIAIVGTNTDLHCNTTSPTKDDSVALILWYKDDIGHPLYSIDARSSDNLSEAKHFSSTERAKLNLTDSISVLTLSPVKEQDSGEYRCRVDFKRGRTINRFLNFQVIVPIKQLVVSSDNGHKIKDIGGPFNEGQPLQLTCEAQGGKPSPVITWFRGSTIIDDTYFMSSDGSSLNILHLPPLKRDDLMMIITCRATNNNLTEPVSHSIAIDLNLKPKEVRIIKPISKLTIGKTIELVCQSTGSKPSAHIKWTIGSNEFDGIGESTSDDGSVTTSFLSFVPSIDDNGKRLTCTVWNPMFTDETLHDEMILNISYTPIVYLAMGVSSRNEKILAGSDIFFECNIQANPMAEKMGWYFNDKLLVSNSSANILIQNNSLLIKDVWKHHEGRYKCWAANDEGQGSSDSIDLNIQFAPICSGNHRVYFGAAYGEQVAITCEVDADPPEVKFTWSFNETSSTPSSTSSSQTTPLSLPLLSSTSNNIELLSLDYSQSGLKSTATYTPKSTSDYGVLFCWAKNSIGLSKEPCRFYIIPAGPPDQPENCTIANITMDSLTVSCWPGYNGGLDQRYHLEMHLDNQDGPLIQNQSTTDYPFFIVKSLSSGNPYTINIYSTNVKGRSDYVVLRGSTQLQAQWHTTDSVEDIVINPMTLMLLLTLGAFMVLGCLTMLIIKFKRSKQRDADSVKIAMNTISDERLQGILMDQDCSSINYGPDIGINHVTKFCANHTNDLYDDHKTIDTIIVPHSGDANFHRICLDNQDLSITNDNDKQTNEMLHVCHVGEGLIGASPMFIEHIYCHQDDPRTGHSSSDIYFRDMVG
ncbi:synaptogenesis protein syg-2-like isoform X2 [Panonychus citri]|uniref:synaptogenesis protein syg-2-like isoform X2 n=1 Tax=Panonychus citri TaxID=50023 RepID=UPI0023074B41|nr:synaptogenesis protein syg-2-like isoform X2 [Panonychus citri]